MQRQSWSSASFRRLQCLSTETIKVSLPSKDNQVHWHVEIFMVIHLYISKTIIVFCLVETIKVICFFTFQRLQCLLSRISQSSLHFKDFNVFRQDYHNLLYISKTSMSFVKTITVFFTFQKTSMFSVIYAFKR